MFVFVFGTVSLISTFAFNHDTFYLMDCYVVAAVGIISWVLLKIGIVCASSNASQETDCGRLRQVIRIIDARTLHFHQPRTESDVPVSEAQEEKDTAKDEGKLKQLGALRHYLESLERDVKINNNHLKLFGRPLTW
jgi:hypothetical protein